jgi:integrase
MARKPTGPWWRADRGVYYVTINGRQIRLDADPEIARARFLALTTQERPLTVGDLVDAWLSAKSPDLSLHTIRLYRHHAGSFAAVAGSLPAADVQPRHVLTWLSSRELGSNTQVIAKRVVKALWSWAVEVGHLERNTLARLRNHQIGRRAHVSEAELARWLGHVTCPSLAVWCEVALGTGMRPGEQVGLEWRHVAQDARYAIVGGKTGKRTVYLSESILGHLRGLAGHWPSGPLLRTSTGRPWRPPRVDVAFQRVSRAAGVRIVPHQLRAQFGSRLHARGVDILTISRLMGHASVTTTARHYVTVASETLLQAIDSQ